MSSGAVTSKPTDEAPDYVDDRELARRTPIKRETWQAWRLRGEGPRFFRVGRRCVYRWSEVAEWIERRAVGAA